MAKYQVVTDQGTFEVETEDNTPVTSGIFGTSAGENSELLRKARVPSDMVRMGGKMVKDSFDPKFQSVPLNAAVNLPGTLVDIGAEGIASTLSPENVMVGGVLKGAQMLSSPVNRAGRAIGRGLESISGLGYKTPGILARITNKPGIPFGKTLDQAREVYGQLEDLGQIPDDLKRTTSNDDFIKKSVEAYDSGKLTPDWALKARQVLDKMKKTMPEVSYRNLRGMFDTFAKKKFAEADRLYREAIDTEAVREWFPVNKHGGTSVFKLAVGGATIPNFLPVASPAAQGAAASLVGGAKMLAAPVLRNPFISSSVGVPAREKYKKWRDGEFDR